MKLSTTRRPSAVSGRAPGRDSIGGVRTVRRLIFVVIAISWRCASVLASDNHSATGVVEGTTYAGAPGDQSPMADVKVRLSGHVTLETKTNVEGKYVFTAVPPGSYTVEARFPGLEATQTTAVEAGRVLQLPLQLKPSSINTSVVVTASETDAGLPSPTTTINEKTVRDAPNMEEKFDSLLPLVPGVVRGPDGHINLKGASSSQSGALVNSANVTDPATGSA